MNLPNKLTLARIVLVPVFMVFAGIGQYGTSNFEKIWYLVAGIIFAIASLTDMLDGQDRPQVQSGHRFRQICGSSGR